MWLDSSVDDKAEQEIKLVIPCINVNQRVKQFMTTVAERLAEHVGRKKSDFHLMSVETRHAASPAREI